MPDTNAAPVVAPVVFPHGAATLTSVTVDAYNAELRDKEGFIGDRASKRAFRAILEDWRERLRKAGGDPLGEVPTEELSKRRLDRLLVDEDPEVAALVLRAVEAFAGELAGVTRRFLRLRGWKDTGRIVVGGGMSGTRVGRLAIGRASLMLRAEGAGVALRPIVHAPDEAALIGAAHLAPAWIFAGHDSLLAVDIGGTNVRTGIVALNLRRAPDLSAARVVGLERWRHRDDEPTRDAAVARIAGMLRGAVERAGKEGLRLAPFVGIGCPGVIAEDGSIERGGQNLPGNWESSRFHLPTALREAVPEIGGHATAVVMHNDAVLQGLSEIPAMRDVERWGVLTIGTGLGNARFTNRARQGEGGTQGTGTVSPAT